MLPAAIVSGASTWSPFLVPLGLLSMVGKTPPQSGEAMSLPGQLSATGWGMKILVLGCWLSLGGIVRKHPCHCVVPLLPESLASIPSFSYLSDFSYGCLSIYLRIHNCTQ